MFGFLKKAKDKVCQHKSLYKVTYVAGAFLDNGIATFNYGRDASEMYIVANSLLDAQVEFAKKMVLTPHIYIHKIEKVIETMLE